MTVLDAKPASVAAPNGADVTLPAASAAAVDAEPVAEASSAVPGLKDDGNQIWTSYQRTWLFLNS